jgi:predicted nucleotidyltransferase
MTDQIEATLTTLLRSHDGVKAAWVFGSVARSAATMESDLDVAVLGDEPLPASLKMKLIEELAQATGRAVDLGDLQVTHGPIVDRVLHDGVRLFCDDMALYAELMKRRWFDRAVWRPYRRRILKERRERWIES